ncbi:MAG: Planktothrix phage PaV-LD [Cyanobacteriota bacterium]|jgi:crossover junction endodeoxyribonuclease RuvC
MIYIGIDPGLTGAIVAFLPSGEIEFHDMPVLEVKKKQQLDYAGLAHILRRYPAHGECMACIELVGAMPGQGVSSMFKFGQVYGAALATLAALQIPYERITPPVWKRAYRLVGCEKDESRARALELFPSAVDSLKLKKHHGRADALLLAEYLRRQSQGGTIST